MKLDTFLCCFVALTLSGAAMAQNQCLSSAPPPPLRIPIRNLTILTNVTRRAAALSFGTPPQEVGFAVLPYVNNIYMYPAGEICGGNSVLSRCAAFLLGTYDYNASSTWRQEGLFANFAPDTVDNSLTLSVPTKPDLAGDILGVDTVHLPDQISLLDFPLDVSIASGTGENMLGLGPNSTLLSRLRSGGHIATKTWSYFFGLYGLEADENMDGSVVLGGYDAAKISGFNHTQSMSYDQSCDTNLMVNVVDIQMDVDGQKSSITNGFQNIRMCVDPSYGLLSLPEVMWETMEARMHSTNLYSDAGLVLGGKVFLKQGLYKGGLTYVLDSGLTISVPSSQLIQPNRCIDDNGKIFFNASEMELMVEDLVGSHANDMPLLGQPFLSAAYLMVNYDDQSFTLWKSQPTTRTNLTAVQPPCVVDLAAPQNSHLNSGAIGGVAVSAVIGVAALFALACFCVRSRWSSRGGHDDGQKTRNDTLSLWPTGLRKFEVSSTPGQQHIKLFEMDPNQGPGVRSLFGLGLRHYDKRFANVSPREIDGGELPASHYCDDDFSRRPKTIEGGEMPVHPFPGSPDVSTPMLQHSMRSESSHDTMTAVYGGDSFRTAQHPARPEALAPARGGRRSGLPH